MADASEPPFDAEELIEHLPALRGLARALVHGDEVKDLVAATMLRAVERPPQQRTHVRAWLARVLRNLATDRRRRRATSDRTVRRLQTAASPSADAPPPDEVFARAEALALLQRTLDELDEADRYLLLLRYFEGLDAPTIGSRLGIPAATVRSRLTRALGRLRARLRHRYGDDAFAPCYLILPPLSGGAAASATTATTLLTAYAMKKTAVVVLPLVLVIASAWYLLDGGGASKGPSTGAGEMAQAVATEAASEHGPDEGQTDARARSTAASAVPNGVLLVDDAQRPLAGTLLALYHEGGRETMRTDEAGVFPWPEDTHGDGLLFITPTGRVPFWELCDADDPPERVEVPVGEEIRFVVEHDGGAGHSLPRFQVDLRDLAGDLSSPAYARRELWMREGAGGLGMDPLNKYELQFRPEQVAAGSFRLWGLPAEWTGELVLPSSSGHFRWLGSEAGFRRTKPIQADEDVHRIELRARALWSLQIERPSSAEDRYGIGPRLSVGRERIGIGGGWYPNESGGVAVFAQPDDMPPMVGDEGWVAELTLWHRVETSPRWTLRLPRGGGDLGTVRIPEAFAVRVQVLDPDGRPIPGAACGWLQPDSALTGVDGIAELPWRAGFPSDEAPKVLVAVQADDYFPWRDEVEVRPDAMQTIVLQPVHGFEVEWTVTQDGRPAPDLLTELEFSCVGHEWRRPGGLFGREMPRDEIRDYVRGTSGTLFGRRNDIWSFEVDYSEPDQEGARHFAVYDLNPTHPVRMTIWIEGIVAHQEVFQEFPQDEILRRELRLEAPATIPVRGIVIDDSGERVSGTDVLLRLSGDRELTTHTNVFGEFVFERVATTEFELRARPNLKEWVDTEYFPWSLTSPDEQIEVVVDRAEPIVVEVVYADGRPWQGSDAIIEDSETGARLADDTDPAQPGRFVIYAPVKGVVDFGIWNDGWTYGDTLDVDAAPHRILLPEHLTGVVRVGEGWVGERPRALRAQPLRGEALRSKSWHLDRMDPDEEPAGEGGQASPLWRTLEVRLPPGLYRFDLIEWIEEEEEWVPVPGAPVLERTIAAPGPVTIEFPPAD